MKNLTLIILLILNGCKPDTNLDDLIDEPIIADDTVKIDPIIPGPSILTCPCGCEVTDCDCNQASDPFADEALTVSGPEGYEWYIDVYGRQAWSTKGVDWFFSPGERLVEGQTDQSGRWTLKNNRIIDNTTSRPLKKSPEKKVQSQYDAIYFGATWCGPCQTVKANALPILKKSYKIQEVDTDENPSLTSRYRITGLPTLVILKDGKEVDRIVGQFNVAQVKQSFANY